MKILIFSISAGFFFWIVMLIAKWVYFKRANGVDRRPRAFLVEEIVSDEIKYHNEATYRALEFYMKSIFGIAAGTGFLFTLHLEAAPVINKTVSFISNLVLMTTVLFCAMILVHQKSKIERWKIEYGLFQPLFWNEFYWFSAAFGFYAIFLEYLKTLKQLFQ